MRGKWVNFVRERGTLILAWISWFMAAAGGSAIAATFIGGAISGTIGIFPAWIATVAFGVGVVAMALDMVLDGIPNRLAIWMAITLPSVARAVPGRLSAEVTHISQQILAAINQWLGVWVGTTSTIGVAAAAVGIALLMARRVIAKGGR